MKTAISSRSRLASAALGLVFLCLSVARAAPVGEPATGASGAAVLFMGADLAMEKDKVFHPVQDVTAIALVIRPGDRPVSLPLAQSSAIRVTEALKLSERGVMLADFQADRAYAPGSDPFTQLATSAALAAGASAEADLARTQVLQADRSLAWAGQLQASVQGTPNEGMGRAAMDGATAARAQAEAALNAQLNTPGSLLQDVGSRAADAGVGASRQLFDAFRLSFKITADRAIAHPYYAVIAEIREPGSKPREVRKWVYVKSLGALAAGEPVSVTIYQSGFTPGYLLEGCTVHVYDAGEELATNLSRKRVSLSEEEAFDYRVIEYLAAHKGQTRPATPVPASIGRAAHADLSAEQLARTCHLRVDQGGRVVAVLADAAGKQPVEDPVLVAALKRLRFTPAMAAGKPVEALVPLALGPRSAP